MPTAFGALLLDILLIAIATAFLVWHNRRAWDRMPPKEREDAARFHFDDIA